MVWGCKRSHACLLLQDVQTLEKIWFTLHQLAGNRFKVILQGTGYLRGPIPWVESEGGHFGRKEDLLQSQDIASQKAMVLNLGACNVFKEKSSLKLIFMPLYSFINSYIGGRCLFVNAHLLYT